MATGAALVFAVILAVWRSSAADARLRPADLSDNPLESSIGAWPERVAMARGIAWSIVHEGKPTYAIYGDFGSGKSTMLNLVAEQLSAETGKAIVVRFNGWLPGSSDDLAGQLWNDIAAACREQYVIPGLRRAAIRLAHTLAASAPYMQGLKEWLPQNAQQDSVAEARVLLRRLPQRVVVLVDEIDRMRKDELLVMLKAIRGFTALPNLTFVCAMERRTVERLVCKAYGSESHVFFQKFFAQSNWLPKLEDTLLENEAAERLTTALSDLGWFGGGEEAKVEYQSQIRSNWREAFAPFCTNLRAIQRLANAVKGAGRQVLEEVNPFDLTLITLLQQSAPEAYDLMWRFRDVLTALDLPQETSDGPERFERDVSSYLREEGHAYSGEPANAAFRAIRNALFPGFEEMSQEQGAGNKSLRAQTEYFFMNRMGAVNMSLRSPSYFPAYFQSKVPVAIFPEGKMKELFEELRSAPDAEKQRAVIVGALKTRETRNNAAGIERRTNLLSKLADRTARALDAEGARNVAMAIVVLVGDPEEPVWTEADLDQAARLAVAVADLLPGPDKDGPRTEFLGESMRSATQDGVAFKIFLSAFQQKERTPESGQQIRRALTPVFLQRMERRYGPNVGVESVDLRLSHAQAFREWGAALRADERHSTLEQENAQTIFWKRYITSTERLAEFSRRVLRAFSPDFVGPTQYSFKGAQILSIEDLLSLCRMFPPGDARTTADRDELLFVQRFLPREAQLSMQHDVDRSRKMG